MPGKYSINIVDGVNAVSNVSNTAGLSDKKTVDTLNLKLLAFSYPGGLARHSRGYRTKLVPPVIRGVPFI